MPRLDGTGPAGAGKLTGWGYGPCGAEQGIEGVRPRMMGLGAGYGRRFCGGGFGRGAGFGRGRGRGLGLGWGMRGDQPVQPLEGEALKSALTAQKDLLKAHLDHIDKQLESL